MSFGRIVSATSTLTGTSTVGEEAAGQTVISVDNTRSFGLDAGFVSIGGAVIAYSAVDRVDSTITLSAPLAGALPAGTQVLMYPFSVQRWAFVQPDTNQDESAIDAVWCLIPHSLAGFVADDGMRPPELMEKVEYVRNESSSSFKIIDVLDRQTQLNPIVIPEGAITETNIAPGSITTPLLAANAVAAENVQATAIDGMVITGATFQTLLDATAGVKIIENSIVGYDENDQVTFLLNGDTGTITMVEPIITGGVWRTSLDGQRVQISEKTETVNGQVFDAGLIEFFSGNPNEVQPPKIVSINDTRLQISSGRFNPSNTRISSVSLDPDQISAIVTSISARMIFTTDRGSGRGATLILSNTGTRANTELSSNIPGSDVRLLSSGAGSKTHVGGPDVDLISTATASAHVATTVVKASNGFTPANAKVVIDAPRIELNGANFRHSFDGDFPFGTFEVAQYGFGSQNWNEGSFITRRGNHADLIVNMSVTTQITAGATLFTIGPTYRPTKTMRVPGWNATTNAPTYLLIYPATGAVACGLTLSAGHILIAVAPLSLALPA